MGQGSGTRRRGSGIGIAVDRLHALPAPAQHGAPIRPGGCSGSWAQRHLAAAADRPSARACQRPPPPCHPRAYPPRAARTSTAMAAGRAGVMWRSPRTQC